MFRIALVGLLHFAFAVPAPADETQVLTGSITRISSDAWSIAGFDSSFELTDTGLSGEIRAERVHLAASGQVFDDIRVRCASITLTTRTIQCAKATFVVTIPGIDRQTIPGAFTYDRKTGAAQIELSSVKVAGARVRFNVTAGDTGIDVRFSGAQLQLAALLDIVANFSDAFAEYSAAGHADIAGTLTARPNSAPRILLVASLGDASLANNAGTIAADGVAGKIDLDITLQADSTRLNLGFTSEKGEAYLEPAYADFSKNAVSLHADDVV
ncbi:MAG: hypothetical protein KJN77_08325, partial [Gammaproteobacteria bacterium]|nr:hypothetical protein [Gammaproteobacteria bacterium]